MSDACKDFLLFLEVDYPKPIIGDLFERKLGAPFNVDYGHHQIAFYKSGDYHYVPLGYVNLLPHKQVTLVGGTVTDGIAFRHVSDQHSRMIREAGGIKYLGLIHAFERYGESCQAFFAYTGNKRAQEVNLNAGFVNTEDRHLQVKFHKKLSLRKQKSLIKMMIKHGRF